MRLSTPGQDLNEDNWCAWLPRCLAAQVFPKSFTDEAVMNLIPGVPSILLKTCFISSKFAHTLHFITEGACSLQQRLRVTDNSRDKKTLSKFFGLPNQRVGEIAQEVETSSKAQYQCRAKRIRYSVKINAL